MYLEKLLDADLSDDIDSYSAHFLQIGDSGWLYVFVLANEEIEVVCMVNLDGKMLEYRPID